MNEWLVCNRPELAIQSFNLLSHASRNNHVILQLTLLDDVPTDHATSVAGDVTPHAPAWVETNAPAFHRDTNQDIRESSLGRAGLFL
jgi:hypothetical protein